jgi:hypothetical protein
MKNQGASERKRKEEKKRSLIAVDGGFAVPWRR